MKNSTLISLIALVLFGLAVLLVTNFASLNNLSEQSSSSLISHSDIRGIAVVHKGIPYTLNFEEQKIAVEAILRAVSVKKSDYPSKKGPFNFDKIIIYRFGAPDVELLPVQYTDLNLIFSLPSLVQDKYYMDLSGGQLKEMISQSFDS